MVPFLQASSSGEGETFLCSREELEASYARCRQLGAPPELTRPRKVLSPTELAPCLKANLLFVTLAQHIIAPICHHKSYLYILCDPELVALKIFAAPLPRHLDARRKRAGPGRGAFANAGGPDRGRISPG